MKAAPVKTDGERLGNEFMNGVFFSAHIISHMVLGDLIFRSFWGSGFLYDKET